MKIRSGFVTNSSSTSFLIITREDLSRENFFELLGVDPTSPIADVFDGFYRAVTSGVIEQADLDAFDSDEQVEQRFGGVRNLSDYMIQKIKDAKGNGGKVIYGLLSSEGDLIESFFCTDSFEVENDEIYFNGLSCVW